MRSHGKFLLLLSLCILTQPVSASAEATSVSSVDQVLSSLAAVVKDRAKEVGTKILIAKIREDLCKGDFIEIGLGDTPKVEGKPRILYLGNDEKECRLKEHNCGSSVLFFKTCRLMDEDKNIHLTDPYFLKTLSRDAVGFATRLAAYKLDDEQFDGLNLGPFTDFIHTVMEQMIKGKNDRDVFVQAVDELVENYSRSSTDWKTYEAMLTSIGVGTADATSPGAKLRTKIKDAIKGKTFKAGNKIYPAFVDDREVRHRKYHELFDEMPLFSRFFKVSCSTTMTPALTAEELKSCRLAQLGYRLYPALDLRRGDDPKKQVQELFFIVEEAEIYEDALKELADDDAKKSFADFAEFARGYFIQNGYAARMAMNNSFALIAAVSSALTHTQQEAKRYLKQLQDDISATDPVTSEWKAKNIADIWNTPSLNWTKRHNWTPYTQNMMRRVRELLATLFFFDKNPEDVKRFRNIAQQIGASAESLTAEKPEIMSTREMVRHFAGITHQVAQIMRDSSREGPSADSLRDFADVLDASARMLRHAQDRDWVAVSFDISDQLRDHGVTGKAHQGLRFTRTLLSMYQADSVDDAKAIFQSSLANTVSREQRWGPWTFDVAALVGVRGGYVRYEWSPNQSANNSQEFGYGLFAPVGVQIAKQGFGCLLYPVDLGGYVSGSNAEETPGTRARSALHSGLAVYVRPWNNTHTPVVFGLSADIKPRFGENDVQETRYSMFITIELPLYIID